VMTRGVSVRSVCLVPAGESSHSALEQIWARPTCDVASSEVSVICGMAFRDGSPRQASARQISFRLVGDHRDPNNRDAFPGSCQCKAAPGLQRQLPYR
jgi:hypothetical protein